MTALPAASTPANPANPANPIDRLLAFRVTLRWEFVFYALLLGVATGLRFWDLGGNSLHHDESIHAQWSWDLLNGNYRHSPVFHGPFYYHLQGAVFFIFGANDYTSRVSAAIFGTALVALPLLLRRWLGPIGTFAAVAFLALSPTVVYYSRFLREDIYMAAFVLVMVAAMWRYLESDRERWLIVLALAFTGAVTTKEGTFLTVAVFLLFLDIYVAAELATQTLTNRGALTRGRQAVLTASYTLLAVPVLAFWPFLKGVRRAYDWDRFPRSGDVLVLLGTLTLPLLTPMLRKPLEGLGVLDRSIPLTDGGFTSRLNWEFSLSSRTNLNDGLALGGLFAVTTSAAAFVGLQWRPRIWAICFISATFIYLTLMTSFWTNKEGLISGPWGSLDYWITQQGEYRGDQPWFYYYMLMPMYEFLPLLIAAGGIWWSVVRGNAFSRFLVFWLAGQWLALSMGSEKMPWLNTHLAVPAAILAAWTINRAWSALRIDGRERDAAVRFGGLAAAALIAALLLVYLPPGAAYVAVRLAATAALLGVLAFAVRPYGLRALGAALCLVAVAGLSFFSIRTMVQASFTRGDIPKDLLIYTQSSPDIRKLMASIEDLGEATGQGKYLPVAVDGQDAFTWPWAWYLRDYKCVTYASFSGDSLPVASCQGRAQPYAVMLVNRANAPRVDDAIARNADTYYGAPTPYPHRWNFEEYGAAGYKSAMSVVEGAECTGQFGDCGLFTGHVLFIPNFVPNTKTWEHIFEGVFQDGWPKTWYRYWRDHDPDKLTGATGPRACNSCGSADAVAYFPAAFNRETGRLDPQSAAAAAVPAAPSADGEGRPTFGGSGFRPGQFSSPVDIEADSQGNLYVVDSARKSVQKFDAAGNFIAGVGVRVKPDDPAEDSQPWGLAIASDGTVVVADTFGWRMRLFDADLAPGGSAFGIAPKLSANTPPGPFELFGPRDATMHDGNIWVTDTGHDRIVVYTLAGEFVRAIGSQGTGHDQFNEPVGIDEFADGSLAVADMFNGRMVILDRQGAYQSEFKVEGWGGQIIEDKPYLRVLRDGRIAVGLPALNQVRIYDRGGAVLGEITGGAEPLSRPYGMVEAADGKLWIVEGGSSRVRLFTLP